MQAGSCVSDIRACISCMLHPQPGLESHTASLLYAGASVAHSKQSHRLTDWFLCVYASSARGQLDSTPGSSSSGSGSSPSWQLQLSNSYLPGLLLGWLRYSSVTDLRVLEHYQQANFLTIGLPGTACLIINRKVDSHVSVVAD